MVPSSTTPSSTKVHPSARPRVPPSTPGPATGPTLGEPPLAESTLAESTLGPPPAAAVRALSAIRRADDIDFLRALSNTPSAMRTLHRCGLRPIAPATASNPGSTPVELLIRLLERANPTFDQDATNALAGNPSAIATLGRLGFVPKEAHHEAKLPPELLNFPILKEAPNVEAALSNPTFKESQKIVQDRPNDADALATLRQATEPVKSAYLSAIEDRVRNGSSPCELRVGEAVEVKKSLRHIFGPPMRIVNAVTGEVSEEEEQFHLTRGTVTNLDPITITSDEGENMGYPANFHFIYIFYVLHSLW